MMHPPHLLVAVTGHGYGHLSQCAPVVNRLRDSLSGLRLTVMTELTREVLEGRLAGDFTSLQTETDPVICMHNAWQVDVTASCHAYRVFHGDWDEKLQQDIARLRSIGPDLLLADIPYRLLLAARHAGIPSIALCSLNWAAIHAAYCLEANEDRVIRRQMLEGYHAAELFLAPAPSLPMQELGNYRAIGPIGRQGRARRVELLEQLSLPLETRLVLVALGGISSRLPLSNWPRMKNVVWLFDRLQEPGRDDLMGFSRMPLPFIDLLASVDAVLTKPGYGTYVEAVCHAVPILTLERPDWPETRYLNRWARQHGCLQEISTQQLQAGSFGLALERLWSQPLPAGAVHTDGIGQAVDVLRDYLS